MQIIPRFHFIISSSVSAEEAFQIASGAYIMLSGCNYRSKEIETKEKWLLLYYPERRRAQFQNPFLPIVWVSFSETADGTDIILDARLRSQIRTVFLYVLFAGLFLEVVFLLLFVFHSTFPVLYLFCPLAVSLSVYLITHLVFFILSKIAAQQFSDEFGYYQ